MEEKIFFFAVNEAGELFNKHFGDAPFFEIYRLNTVTADMKFIKNFKNKMKDFVETQKHGDDKKRGGILSLLKEESDKIDFMLSKVKSPNFAKLKKTTSILPIVFSGNKEDALRQIQENLDLFIKNFSV